MNPVENRTEPMRLSVVIPCYYAEAVIAKVVNMTRDELVKAGYCYEFILVNDGSTDATFSEIEKLCALDENIKGINLMKNFGQHNAIMAGLHEVSGDWVMIMDDDMQTHPSQCVILLDKMKEGHDVVFAEYDDPKKSWIRSMGSHFAMWSIRVLAGCPKGIVDSNFIVLTRTVCDAVLSYASPSVYIQGLLFRTTDSMANVTVKHFERESGSSGYTFKSLVRLWSTILNFSATPLRIASVLGFLMGLAGFVGAAILFFERLSDPYMQMGWASTMVTILICSGAILFCMGLVGEYVGRLFMTSNHQPQFIVRTEVNCDTVLRTEAKGKTNNE